MQHANENPNPPGWLRALIFGRHPRRTLIRVGILVATCFVVFKFMLLPIRIDGISMQPTYHTGQIKCINRLAYLRHDPQRGDIISVRLSAPDGLAIPSIMYLKRILALPGETISFQDGHAFINGQRLDEPYVKLPCDWDHAPIVCGPDQYYVVGDNRSMSFESHEQGRTRRNRIVGKLFL